MYITNTDSYTFTVQFDSFEISNDQDIEQNASVGVKFGRNKKIVKASEE